jgi:hypothetical protein
VGGDEVISSGANNCLPDVLLAQLSEEERDNLNIHTADDLRKATAEVIGKSPELTQKILQSAERLKAINKDVLMAGGSVMSDTADMMLVADKWLEQHPQVQGIVDGLGKGVSAALWLKYAKTVGPMGLLTGLAVDYGYDKLVENLDLDIAKADFAAYLLSKDSDLNQEQADILASAAIKVTKEAGRILTHKMAADGVQGIRKYFSEKGAKVSQVPDVSIQEEIRPTQAMSSEIPTGQKHHLLSKGIMEELNEHKTLKGIFDREDQRFIYRAFDQEAHKGYQSWHRDYDMKVKDWLLKNEQATEIQFKQFLHGLYQDPELKARIPNVNLLED